MTVRYVEVLTCDRCGEEFQRRSADSVETKTISGLKWMVLRNGGGSSDSNMALDLCHLCTKLFQAFMRNCS